MIKWEYRSDGWRPDPALLGRAIDIGGANSFAYGHLDAVVDIREPIPGTAKQHFVGDINGPDIWERMRHESANIDWDYAICTHTLEDIINPVFVLSKLEEIAVAGLIIVPSKFREFARFQGPFRGFMHHHWIFDVVDGILTAFPKLNFIEDPIFNVIPGPEVGGEELVIWWEGEIPFQMINKGMPYGTDKLSGEQHMMELYKRLIP